MKATDIINAVLANSPRLPDKAEDGTVSATDFDFSCCTLTSLTIENGRVTDFDIDTGGIDYTIDFDSVAEDLVVIDETDLRNAIENALEANVASDSLFTVNQLSRVNKAIDTALSEAAILEVDPAGRICRMGRDEVARRVYAHLTDNGVAE